MVAVKVGMIGLDTSHVVAFTQLLNNPEAQYHVPGAQVICAFPGGSPDWEMSWSRLEGFTQQVQEFGVKIVDSIAEVAQTSDAILLESVDGRVHLAQFREIAPMASRYSLTNPLPSATGMPRKWWIWLESTRSPDEFLCPALCRRADWGAGPL